MIDLRKHIPSLIVEMRYATNNNFTGQKLYDSDECYLIKPAADRLLRVQKKLLKKKLCIKIWDAYRPLPVQYKLWEAVPDERYVANPKSGSKHNRGASVDLTLVDEHGKELEMPTAFDEFSEKAHRNYENLPKKILHNRKLLESIMESEGFIGLPTEWWHFDDPEWASYEIRSDSLSMKFNDYESFPVPNRCKQLIVVRSEKWTSDAGILTRYEKINGQWTQTGKPWPVMLGSMGLRWGRGLHTNGPTLYPKREGDKTSPAGVFKIGHAYGRIPLKISWPYQVVDKNWVCIDDSLSKHYNSILDKRKVNNDWDSHEDMTREDSIYNLVINIEQNYPRTVSGCGSCVFLHVWRKRDSTTDGCTAMKRAYMLTLLSWLREDASPHIIQLPDSEYLRLKTLWKLP